MSDGQTEGHRESAEFMGRKAFGKSCVGGVVEVPTAEKEHYEWLKGEVDRLRLELASSEKRLNQLRDQLAESDTVTERVEADKPLLTTTHQGVVDETLRRQDRRLNTLEYDFKELQQTVAALVRVDSTRQKALANVTHDVRRLNQFTGIDDARA
jgi:chromosome segregation ATPase